MVTKIDATKNNNASPAKEIKQTVSSPKCKSIESIQQTIISAHPKMIRNHLVNRRLNGLSKFVFEDHFL